MRTYAALALAIALIVPSVAQAGFRVSSFKKETRLGANHWNVGSALDSDLETCWMVDPEHENPGEWIEIDVPRSTVDKLAFVIGYAKTDETFSDYARLKKIKVEIYKEDDGDEIALTQELDLEDVKGWQEIDLPDTEVGGEYAGGKVRISVLEVYEGVDYPALGVSEVLVRLLEKPAPIGVKGDPSSAVQGHEADKAVDESTRTFWLSGSNTDETITVGATDFGLASIGIQPGPATYARPKTVVLGQGLNTTTIELENNGNMQWFPIPPTIGYTGSAWGDITLTIKDVHPGSKTGVGITEIKLKSTNYDG